MVAIFSPFFTHIVASRTERRRSVEQRREDIYLEVVSMWRQLDFHFKELAAADDKSSVKLREEVFVDLMDQFSRVSVFGSASMMPLIETARVSSVKMFDLRDAEAWDAFNESLPDFRKAVRAVEDRARVEIGSRRKQKNRPWKRNTDRAE